MFDVFDADILRAIQENAKVTIKELSDLICLSPTPTYERVRKLEKEGVITGYHAHLDRKKLGLALVVMCQVSLKLHQQAFIRRFEEDIIRFEEVREVYHIAGMYDYLLKVIVTDMDAYQDFVSNKLASLENIGNVQSSFVMKEVHKKLTFEIQSV
jgi:DNA-binding Lrp family transcriptional regulator